MAKQMLCFKHIICVIIVTISSQESHGASLNCTFDDDFCAWHQDYNDNFDWIRRYNRPWGSKTGPDSDHTSGYGQYTYIDSSEERGGYIGRLVSPVQSYGKFCLSFWYYMYGADVDRLRVQKWKDKSNSEELFRENGNKGQKWIFQNIFIDSTTQFVISFEGRVKRTNSWWNHDEGDIAIDDVHFVSCQDCEDPRTNHSIANTSNFQYDARIEIACDTGYYLIGKPTLVCQANVIWNGRFPICKLYDCGPKTILNGMFYAPGGTTFGKLGIYQCNHGYTFVGDKTVSCTVAGWNSSNAACIVIDCGYVTVSHGKFLAPQGTTFGKTGTYECNTGYTLVGESAISCTDLGWNSTHTSCKAVDTENGILLAVYVVAPVIVAVLSISALIFFFRKRLVKCTSNLDASQESQNSNFVLYFNTALTEPIPKRQNHSNQTYTDLSTPVDHEYMTIIDHNRP